MTAKEILNELKPLGRESYKRVLLHNYGVKEPCDGVPISELNADLGDKDCQIPFAPDYIRKVQQRGSIGKKRKILKC